MMNQGLTGPEIAETMETPPGLAAQWHTHGYYGSVSHNVKAIYQRYMGWYDGNPANLWAHPPEAAATRYVEAMGGRDAALAVARAAFDDGDYRWAAEVGKHLVFADADDAEAREVLATTFEQLAFGAENGIWRNVYLAGTTELRNGIFGTPTRGSQDIVGALSVSHIFDSIATRLDGPRAWDTDLTIGWVITDESTNYLLELRNGALHHRTVEQIPDGVTTFTLTRPLLIGIVTQKVDPVAAVADGSVVIDGDGSVLGTLVGLVSPPDPAFAIVTP
jgi:alkyl sulfatase BDS1-like metallo-beta-lactamase superfamily hydrolase